MKKIFLAMALMASLGTAAKADIVFNHGSWNEILAEATQQKKLVFVDAFTTWCGPCKWMAANTFTNSEVADFFNANFINAKIDMEKGEGVGLAQKYNVNAYPTLLFVDGKGELVHVAIGALDPAQFMALGKNVLDPSFMSMPKMKAKYASGNYDRDFHASYILKMREAGGDFQEALDAFKPGMNGAVLLEEANWSVFKELFVKLDSEPAKYFFAHLTDFEKRYGAEVVNMKALSMYAAPMIQAIYRDGTQSDYDAARKALISSKLAGAENRALMHDMDWYSRHEDWKNYAKATCAVVENTPDMSAMGLNSCAWGFYENVEDPKMLKKALAWADKACTADPQYAIIDTKAMLEWKLGMKNEAIASAKRAIAAAEATGEDASSTKEALQEMEGK